MIEISKTTRCAIYTRKSTEEGLEKEFNTLDAQRESAEAYILSQREAGWTTLEKRYDDGGFTGGNTNRPGLQELLSDIRAGAVDCVVVYKVDRLSRSLLDFAQMMQVFDEYQVAFVAVTQQINTASSAGRLMLNVLLSFAQFERELIAERTRDKMGAARRKGKWLGSNPVLGYDVDRQARRLVINRSEAERVREIFHGYLKADSLRELAQNLNGQGWQTKAWQTKDGQLRGGRSFTKATLQYLLKNATYRGQVLYRGKLYPGEHEAIVDTQLFSQVQQKLRKNRHTQHVRRRQPQRGLLQDRLFCSLCQAKMVHTYTQKGKRRYRYYVCSKADGRRCSVPAAEMESYVRQQVTGIGSHANQEEAADILRVDYHPESGELNIHVSEETHG